MPTASCMYSIVQITEHIFLCGTVSLLYPVQYSAVYIYLGKCEACHLIVSVIIFEVILGETFIHNLAPIAMDVFNCTIIHSIPGGVANVWTMSSNWNQRVQITSRNLNTYFFFNVWFEKRGCF